MKTGGRRPPSALPPGKAAPPGHAPARRRAPVPAGAGSRRGRCRPGRLAQARARAQAQRRSAGPPRPGPRGAGGAMARGRGGATLRARAMAAADAEVRSGAGGPAAGAGGRRAGGGRARRSGAPSGRAGAPGGGRARASPPPPRLRPRPGRGPGRAGRAAPGALCAGAGGGGAAGRGRRGGGGGPAAARAPAGLGRAPRKPRRTKGKVGRAGQLRGAGAARLCAPVLPCAPLTFHFVPNRRAASLTESWPARRPSADNAARRRRLSAARARDSGVSPGAALGRPPAAKVPVLLLVLSAFSRAHSQGRPAPLPAAAPDSNSWRWIAGPPEAVCTPGEVRGPCGLAADSRDRWGKSDDPAGSLSSCSGVVVTAGLLRSRGAGGSSSDNPVRRPKCVF